MLFVPMNNNTDDTHAPHKSMCLLSNNTTTRGSLLHNTRTQMVSGWVLNIKQVVIYTLLLIGLEGKININFRLSIEKMVTCAAY